MTSISVVLATFNEEDALGDCLESVQDFATEILVVDGSSIDKTREIAEKFHAKVIKTTNPPIFHVNKQKAIELATCDWILQLDADERVTPELKKEIISIINANPEENGFWLPRKNYFLGKYLLKGGQFPDYTLRLYRKGKGYLPCKDVHEQAIVEGKTAKLANALLHIADPSFSRYLLRFDRYTTLFAEDLITQNKKNHFFLFLQYFLIQPLYWFISTYFRHKGFRDGFPGFVFSYFSALRYPVTYIKFWEKKNAHRS